MKSNQHGAYLGIVLEDVSYQFGNIRSNWPDCVPGRHVVSSIAYTLGEPLWRIMRRIGI